MNIAWLVEPLLKWLFPKAPAWVPSLIARLLPEIVDLVQTVIQDDSISPVLTIEAVREILDESLDVIPGWADLEEGRRDLVLAGLTELALFLYGLADEHHEKVKPRLVKKEIRGVARDILAKYRSKVEAL